MHIIELKEYTVKYMTVPPPLATSFFCPLHIAVESADERRVSEACVDVRNRSNRHLLLHNDPYHDVCL